MVNDDLNLLHEYARCNSEKAFAELVSRHVNLVYSVAMRQLRDPQLAEEITQAVFIILARKADSLGPNTILSGWLCRTARYASANALTVQHRRQRREQEAHMQSIVVDEPESEAWRQMAPWLDGALEKLGQKDHDALVLRFFENKSFKEVGATLRASEDAAKKRVNRALEKLRKYFSKRGVVLTAAIIAGAISTNVVQAAPVALAQSVTAVAITNGATASGSTLIIVKGALELMTWTKLKTAIVVGAIMLLAVGTAVVAEKQPSPVVPKGTVKNVASKGVVEKESDGIEYRGTLKFVFNQGGKTNIFGVRLWSKPPYWELSLGSHKVFGSPEQTFEVDLHDSPPAGPLNTASIKVYPGSRPLFDPYGEHVWLALLSHDTFIGRQLPLRVPGLRMAFSSTITQVTGTVQDASPRQMQWTNSFPHGISDRIEGEFKWLTSANSQVGLNFPTVSQMAMYIVDSTGKRQLASISELVIASVGPSSTEPSQVPTIPGRNVVEDFRFCDFSDFGSSRTNVILYDVFNGEGLEKMPKTEDLVHLGPFYRKR